MIQSRSIERTGVVVAATALLLWAGGCIAYHPAPLRPEQSQAAFKARSLSDPKLLAFVNRRSDTQPASAPAADAWELDSLARAALYLHPDIDVAIAHLLTVRAAQTTAGEGPNPTVAFAPQYSTNPGDASPWTLGFTFDIPIETADKAQLRVVQAKALSGVALLDLGEAAWRVRGRVRDALADYLIGQREVELLGRELDARTAYVKLLDARLAAGEVGRVEVDAARIDLLTARQAWRSSTGRLADARTRLAVAVGIPTTGLGNAMFVWADIDRFAPVNAETVERLQAAGLLNRIDIRRGLADYAAAEAALQLEVAKQYPDVHLGPGYTFDQGQRKWELGLSMSLPLANTNRGAIGEAAARRDEVATKFVALQAQVMGETELALARLRSALEELEEAEGQLASVDRQWTAGRRALEAGEQDRLAVTGLEVQHAVAARQRLDAVRKARAARGALEDAIQKPLTGPTTMPAPATREDRGP